jgi:hypothetical protein
VGGIAPERDAVADANRFIARQPHGRHGRVHLEREPRMNARPSGAETWDGDFRTLNSHVTRDELTRVEYLAALARISNPGMT